MSKFAWPKRMAKIAMLTTVFAAGGTGVALASGMASGDGGVLAGNQAPVLSHSDQGGPFGLGGSQSGGSSEYGQYGYKQGNDQSSGGRYTVVIGLGHRGSKPCHKGHEGRYASDYGTVVTSVHHASKPCRKGHQGRYASDYGTVVTSVHHASKPCRKGHEGRYASDYGTVVTSVRPRQQAVPQGPPGPLRQRLRHRGDQRAPRQQAVPQGPPGPLRQRLRHRGDQRAPDASKPCRKGHQGRYASDYGTVVTSVHHASKPCRKGHQGRYASDYGTVVTSVHHASKPCRKGHQGRYASDYGTVVTSVHHASKPCRKGHGIDYRRTVITTVVTSVQHSSKPCRRGHSHIAIATSRHGSKPCHKRHSNSYGQPNDNNHRPAGTVDAGNQFQQGLPQSQQTELSSYTVGSGLPTTGADITGLLAVAGLATAFGSGTLFMTRRRRTSMKLRRARTSLR